MSQLLTPTPGSNVGRYSIAADAAEALSAANYVAKAEDGSLVRLLVLSRVGLDPENVKRVAGEVKKLSHENVLQLLDVESVDGRIAVAMQHVDGISLQTLLTAAGADGLPRGAALRIVLDLLAGLEAAHTAGHSHGELNPHLVLLGADGKARIMCAGLTKALGKTLAPKTTSDRLAYIAPERVKLASMAKGPAPEPKGDVFSVAVLIWELIAKQRLFAGRLESAVIQKVLTAPIAPLAASAEDLPDGFDELVKKALERDPSRRVVTVRELADAISSSFEGKLASHEEVAKVLEDVGQKPLGELRARIAAAPETSVAASPVVIPAARASLPTLDEEFVEVVEEGPKPVARPPALKPPKPPPRVPGKPAIPTIGLPKPPAIKVAPAPLKPSATGDAEESADVDVAVDDDAAAPADAAAADAAAEASPPDSKAPESRTPASPGNPKLSLKRPLKAPLPVRVPGTKRTPGGDARKGTLLGVAPPGTEAAKHEPGAATPAAPIAVPVPTPDKAPESASAKADKSAPETATPTSKPSPVSTARPPIELETTPSTGPNSLAERKKRAMPGNLRPGDALGRYELLLPVASGGMAAVWAARLQGTAGFQKIVAIKTMLPGLSSDQDFEEMFLDEARVAARIRHPNVVEIFDLGEEDDTLYLVMEWVEGETLGSLQKGSKAHGGIPLPILLRIASQACAGLHAAHELRDDKGALVDLVHRDISPANILVSRTGFVKIVDFGVAKSKARMYTTRVGGMIKGKTPYLSPEQLAGQTIDRRSDLYSFGAVLYVLATGLHPFRGETEAKTIENIALRDPVPLRKIDPNIHPELEAIILKALQKERDQRYESASEMQRAIDTLAASIGQAVNDDDVASFVRTVAGEALDQRAGALREAITAADAGKLAPTSRKDQKPDDDAAKVDIDDVDVDESKAKEEAPADEAAAAAEGSSDADLSLGAAPAVNAASLGSDAEPASPPVDTLAAASTEPSVDEEGIAPRRRGPLLALGGALGVGLLIALIALMGGSGDEKNGPAAQASGASTTAAEVRTGAPATEPPATTAEPAATAEPTAEPEPSASAEASAEPEATTEPEASAAPEPTASPVASTVKTTPVSRPYTKPVTRPGPAVKPTSKPKPKPFEPDTL